MAALVAHVEVRGEAPVGDSVDAAAEMLVVVAVGPLAAAAAEREDAVKSNPLEPTAAAAAE